MSMKPSWRALISAGFAILSALNILASDVKIIANASVKADSISTGELRSVYLLQRKTLREGSPVEPVLQKGGGAHEMFLKLYLKRDTEELHIYYQGLVFTGKASMPKELSSDDEVVAYVARTRGTIGYVNGEASTDGVKILLVSDNQNVKRTLVKRVEPEYPDTLRRLQIGGTVRLSVTVSPKGIVENVALIGGNPILAEAAAKAVRQWIYSPAATRSTIEVTVPFEQRP
jgi:TonB family protein